MGVKLGLHTKART